LGGKLISLNDSITLKNQRQKKQKKKKKAKKFAREHCKKKNQTN